MTGPARIVELSMFPDIRPDKPVGTILPSVFIGTNAELMRVVAPYYLTGTVLDVTYGEGKWWTLHQPADFTAHDLYKLDGIDFTALPERDSSIDTVCYDPPYVASGGPATVADVDKFRDGFGIDHIENPADLDNLIAAGLTEACRVSRGFVLVKCMEYTSGKFHDPPTDIINTASRLGWPLWDRIVHHTGSGPGGHNIFTPKHARRHHSHLLVFAR